MITALNHLEDLLITLFDERELRDLFDRLGLGNNLPGTGTSYSHLVHSAVQILYRRGRINAPLLAVLLANAGNHATAVHTLAAEFGLVIGAEAAPPRLRGRHRPQRHTVRPLQTLFIAGSFLPPLIIGWTMRGSEHLGPGLVGAFLCGPLATLALLMKRTIAFAGSLIAGLRLLDRTSLIPVAAAAMSAALGTAGTATLDSTVRDDARPQPGRADLGPGSNAAKKRDMPLPPRLDPHPLTREAETPPAVRQPTKDALLPNAANPLVTTPWTPTMPHTVEQSGGPQTMTPRRDCLDASHRDAMSGELDSSIAFVQECVSTRHGSGIEIEAAIHIRKRGSYIVAGGIADGDCWKQRDSERAWIYETAQLKGRSESTEVIKIFIENTPADSRITIGVFDSGGSHCTTPPQEEDSPLPPTPFSSPSSFPVDEPSPLSNERGAETTITVRLDDTKPSGLAWDVGSTLPEPYVVVDGRSLRSARCEDNRSCSWTLPGAQEYYNVAVYDADLSDDDYAGTVQCRRGYQCTTGRGATVTIF